MGGFQSIEKTVSEDSIQSVDDTNQEEHNVKIEIHDIGKLSENNYDEKDEKYKEIDDFDFMDNEPLDTH